MTDEGDEQKRACREQKRPPRDRQIKNPRRDREEGDDHD